MASTRQEEIERERAALQSRFGDAYTRLEAIFFEEDPIRINFGSNTDEYDPEVRTVLPRLAACSTVEDVQTTVHEEFCAWFDPDTAGPRERYAGIARRIMTELGHVVGRTI